jgi:hypothetical protein
LSVSNDNDSAGFRNVTVRRNRFIGGGNQLVGISGCVDCTFEDNLLWSDWSGDLVFLNASYAPNGAPTHNAATCIPTDVWGKYACDDHTARLKVLNNTFYRGNTSSQNKFIQVLSDGVGLVVANNALWGGGSASGTNCINNTTGAAPAFVGSNYCRAGSGDAAASVFVSAPADFAPLAGGPLAGTGNATYASPYAIGTSNWSAFDGAKDRALPPDIGAFSR